MIALPTSEVFLDTSYALALTVATDVLHSRALQVQEELLARPVRLVTTRGVLLEIGNALARQRWRPAAVELLQTAEEDDTFLIEPWSESTYKKALDWYCRYKDKNWGLVDCMSFVVMEARGMNVALTADEHFVQRGYRAVLRETGPVLSS
jgi:predicted nucleic acid-binding protein